LLAAPSGWPLRAFAQNPGFDGEENAPAVSQLKELAATYRRGFARGADGEPSSVSSPDLAAEIKTCALKLMNRYIQWKNAAHAPSREN
jgi:hypothetical protein